MKIELTHLPDGARLTLILSLILIIGCRPSLPDDIKFAYQDLPEKVDFNFHIKPILSDRCYKCHGPDDNARQADFRLDLEETAFAKLKKSEGSAFVHRNIGKSVAWQRITSDDPDFHMPPPESNLSLSNKEIALRPLRKVENYTDLLNFSNLVNLNSLIIKRIKFIKSLRFSKLGFSEWPQL